MDPIRDLNGLLNKTISSLDDWSNFFEHTRGVWRAYQMAVTGGLHTLPVTNAATGHQYSAHDLSALAQDYMTGNLAPFALGRYTAIFESFVFGFLRILLLQNPGVLSDKPLKIGDLIRAGSIESAIAQAIDRELRDKSYDRPAAWFAYIESVQKLGCPASDEIAQIAEIKATRDVLEHAEGIINRTYLDKAGKKARFTTEGESIDVSDLYLRDSWDLLKKICNDMTAAAIKILSLKPPK